MDKKQKSIFLSILVILVLISLLVGYTFAKYYSSYSATSSTQIAKWNFKVNDWSTQETQVIPLVNTASDISLDEGKIAPGAKGSFELVLDASGSEVDVAYSIEANETGNKPENIRFYAFVNDKITDYTYESLTDLASSELFGVILKSEENQRRVIRIYWSWPYEFGATNEARIQEDNEDTAIGTGNVQGKEDNFDYAFSLKVIGTQARSTT